MLHAEGVADLLQGDLDRADVLFARAADEATSAGVVPFVPLALAERGIVAIARDDWEEAQASLARGAGIMRANQFDDYWTSALVYAWGARVAAHRADLEQARELVRRAARLRPLLTYALPIVSAQALGSWPTPTSRWPTLTGARRAPQLKDLQHHRPDLGTLLDEADELRSQLDVPRGDVLGVASLTTAELRLLPLLPTHLTLARDQRAAVRLPEHCQDPGHLGVPQAGRLQPQRDGRPHARARPTRPDLSMPTVSTGGSPAPSRSGQDERRRT